MTAPFSDPPMWRHTDGSKCLHELRSDSGAPEGLYCVVRGDVVISARGRTYAPPPPPSRYLDPPAGRHQARPQAPGMFPSWLHALGLLGLVTLSSAALLALLAWLVLTVARLLS